MFVSITRFSARGGLRFTLDRKAWLRIDLTAATLPTQSPDQSSRRDISRLPAYTATNSILRLCLFLLPASRGPPPHSPALQVRDLRWRDKPRRGPNHRAEWNE